MPETASFLKGRAALVTGGNRGIGRAIAGALAGAGAAVGICGRDETTLAATAETLGGSWWSTDVRDSAAVDRMVDAAAEKLGRLDIVVHSAGTIARRKFLELTVEEWHAVIETNLTAAFTLTRAALRHLPEHDHARIIHISSVVGIFGVPENAPYVASKHGLHGLTRTAALELAPKGITVNALCPGWTDTDMTDQGVRDLAKSWGVTEAEVRSRIEKKMIPIGRLLRPEEVAAAVLWLCRPESDAVTAQAIRIDGGQTPF